MLYFCPSRQLDSIGEFLNITLVAVAMLPPFVFVFEGSEATSSITRLSEAGTLDGWMINVLLSRWVQYQSCYLVLIPCSGVCVC